MRLLVSISKEKQMVVEKRPKIIPLEKNRLDFVSSLAISLMSRLSNPRLEINSKIAYRLKQMENLPNSAGPSLRATIIARINKEAEEIILVNDMGMPFFSVDLIKFNNNLLLSMIKIMFGYRDYAH